MEKPRSSVVEQLRPLFRPRTVAVVGASRKPEKIGYQVVRNLMEGGFPRDRIFPINPYADEILGLKAYPSVKDVPEEVDLAVICVPARIVFDVVRDCGEKGVKAIAMITAGFGEVGNVEEERRLVELVRSYGMRLLGPNIVGVCDTVNRMNASFCQALPPPGDIAFITQSGALGIALVGWTIMERIGLSDLVSVGNKADVDDADLLEFFAHDPHTRAIALYIEGVKNGRRFFETARRVSKQKPIVALKAGRSERGAAAAASHTGALAGADRIYDAAFQQSGIIRAYTIDQLFDWCIALASQPPPRKRPVVIVTNGGGAGVMATDACADYGLALEDPPDDLKNVFRQYMPPFGSTRNPIDLTGMARRDEYYGAVLTALQHSWVGAVIVLYCHTAITTPREVADAILDAIRQAKVDKPVTVSFIGGAEADEASDYLRQNRVPCYPTPERAVAAMGALYRRAEYLGLLRD
ncbi:CoA-binding protein [archaeon]|nr:CoA-binding protein [archaeon]